jgi:hypothetical protein
MSDLTCIWVGETDGKSLYRIYNQNDYRTNDMRTPLGRMTVDKKTQQTSVQWDKPHMSMCNRFVEEED